MNIYECVPNLSEGRSGRRIERLAAAAVAGGASLLHRTSDADHHRSVLTLAGTLPALESSLEDLYAEALISIDLRSHAGVHPRIGALDVAPIVPLGGAPEAPAQALVRRLGARLASRHGLPVLLYERSASGPERSDLARHRRGGLAALAGRLSGDWPPDFGPARPHPTGGATVLGVRGLLIAFNVVLEGGGVRVARRIARRIRTRDGGLPALKALGLELSDGRAQVSMNLTDFAVTGLYTAFEAVCRQAEAHGCGVRESELIGLAPRAALAAGDPERLRLAGGFSADLVLENRLESALGVRL
ncbi:MAG: glutamate formimidoyltransferase [Acidobacteriota bacterium]